jgi:hypothetical protein
VKPISFLILALGARWLPPARTTPAENVRSL